MTDQWQAFYAKIQSEIDPLLHQMGYVVQIAKEFDDDSDGFFIIYRKGETQRIFIDIMGSVAFRNNQVERFNWLRVDTGGRYLKELVGLSSSTDMHLHDGWIYTHEEELSQIVEEVITAFKLYFSDSTS